MSKHPQNPTTISSLIAKAYEAQPQSNRPYLGMSQIGEACLRKQWYEFRQVDAKHIDGRIRALFERGHNEEPQIAKKLQMIGIKVVDRDANGGQFELVGYKGHFLGHFDAALYGVPEAANEWHVGEFKTHNDKSWQHVATNGVQKAKPVHYIQMQCYMGFSGMTSALYVAINKNDDSIYTERVNFDSTAFNDLCAKAAYIIDAQEPPERLSNDPTSPECQWCYYRNICYQGKVPQANCRTCVQAEPIVDGKWTCKKHGNATGLCGDHLYIPALLGEPTHCGDGYVMYPQFINATASMAEGCAFEGHRVYTSAQLQRNRFLAITADRPFAELRKVFAK